MSVVHAVRGSVAAEDVGICDMHEHIAWATPGWEHAPDAPQRFPRPAVFEKVLADYRRFHSLGGRTVVDLTGIAMGRDATLYADLSREADVHIVAATGFGPEEDILAFFRPSLESLRDLQKPPLYARDIDYLADLFVHELTNGMGTTDICAGVIVATAVNVDISQLEDMVFRAAARASKRTGAAIMTHGAQSAEQQADLFVAEDVDPSRVVLGPWDNQRSTIESQKRLAQRGFLLRYGQTGAGCETPATTPASTIGELADHLAGMLRDGLVEQIVFGSDTIGWNIDAAEQTESYATASSLIDQWGVELRKRGVSDEELDVMFVANPRTVLPF